MQALQGLRGDAFYLAFRDTALADAKFEKGQRPSHRGKLQGGEPTVQAGGAAFAHPGDWDRKSRLMNDARFEPPRMGTIGEGSVPKLSFEALAMHEGGGRYEGAQRHVAASARGGASSRASSASAVTSSSVYTICTQRGVRDPHPNTMFKESEGMQQAKVKADDAWYIRELDRFKQNNIMKIDIRANPDADKADLEKAMREKAQERYAHKLLIKQDNQAAILQRAMSNDEKKARYEKGRLELIREHKLQIEGGTGDMYKGLRKGKAGDVETQKQYDKLRFFAEGPELERRLAVKRATYNKFAERLQAERDKMEKRSGGHFEHAWPFIRRKSQSQLQRSPDPEDKQKGGKKYQIEGPPRRRNFY